MAVFEQGAQQWERLDWRLLYNSPITLYFSGEVLSGDVSWFADAGYTVLPFETASVNSLEALLTGLGKLFSFPDYYGRNLDAFNDCLSDLEIPDIGGVLLVLRDFDRFAAISPEAAHAILDICADNSRRFLMTGKRFAVLVHSSDPRISFPPVGASGVVWNPQEFLDAKRGL
jgi:RNAse (barnase) inhibitor barstar